MPLSEACHQLQHFLGWLTFAKRFLGAADPREMCLAYWRLWKGDKGELS